MVAVLFLLNEAEPWTKKLTEFQLASIWFNLKIRSIYPPMEVCCRKQLNFKSSEGVTVRSAYT